MRRECFWTNTTSKGDGAQQGGRAQRKRVRLAKFSSLFGLTSEHRSARIKGLTFGRQRTLSLGRPNSLFPSSKGLTHGWVCILHLASWFFFFFFVHVHCCNEKGRWKYQFFKTETYIVCGNISALAWGSLGFKRENEEMEHFLGGK